MAKHLFIDDRFVAEAPGLTRRFHQARKCERNPVIRADRPWEKDAAFIDSAMVVIFRREEQARDGRRITVWGM